MTATTVSDRPAPNAQISGCPTSLEDPAETLHVWFAMLGIALQPISTATGNIGLGVAGLGLGLRMAGVTLHPMRTPCGHIAHTLCQIPQLLKSRRLLEAWIALIQRPWMLCLLAWVAWTWLSLAWSPDRHFGVEQFRASRVLLWIPLLWPIRHRWKSLVAGMLVGVTVMNVLQAMQVRMGWPASPFPMGSALTTPTQTGLWAAVALSYWLIITVASNLALGAFALPLAALSGVGLVWSATRASVIGLMAELVLANVVLAITSRGWMLRAALRCLVGAVILGAAMMFAGAYLQNKMTLAINETKQSLQGGNGVTSEIRIAMWKAALQGWREHPIAGVGVGGIPSVLEKTNVTTPAVDMKTVRMIHSTYVEVLVETGAIGLALFLGFTALLFRDVLRGLKGQPLLVASFGALVVWFVAAAFDGYQQSGGFLTVGAILIPLALANDRQAPLQNAAQT